MVKPIVTVHDLYDGKISIEFNRRGHKYRLLPERRLLFSATKINKILSKPMLVPWAARIAAEHIECELAKAGTHWADACAKAISDAKTAHSAYAQQRQKIGSLAHAWIEAYVHFEMGERETPKRMPKVEDAAKACQAFLNWRGEHDVEWLWAERLVYSKEHGYVGTADAGAIIDDEGPEIVDFKTGSGVFFEAGIQTSLYGSALREEFPDLWGFPRRRIIHACSINGRHNEFDEESIKEKLTGGDFEEDFQAGLHAQAMTHWIGKGPSAWIFDKRW